MVEQRSKQRTEVDYAEYGKRLREEVLTVFHLLLSNLSYDILKQARIIFALLLQ
jgi:hypothetical protein